MSCRKVPLRENWVEVRIVVDHGGTVAQTVYTNAGRAPEISNWLRQLANVIYSDIAP